MKRTIAVLTLLLAAGCAAKEPPFDYVTVFKDAETSMQEQSFEKARKKYQEIQEKSPDKSYDAFLMLRIADTYYGEEKYSEALVEYRAFLNYHPVHKDAAYAQYQVALCSYRELSTTDRDPAPAAAVIREMRVLLDRYPRSGYEEYARKYIAECQNWIADYELYVARFYYKKGSYKAAAGRCERLLREHAGSPAEQDALYVAALAYQELGEKERARALFETLEQKYPAMKDRAEARIKKLSVL
jgi:outer membrane protein assembly factor BamD